MIGSLFSGYGGLETATRNVFGGEVAWVSDIDPGACKILAHHWPDVPNLGDISAVDWSQVEPVDIITGGFPCTDVSMAGARAGLHGGTRSGLWARMHEAIAELRPSLVVIENVRGLLTARGAEPTFELLAAWADRDRWSRVARLIESKRRKAHREGKMEYVHRHTADRVRIMGRLDRAVAAARRADARIIRAIGTVLGSLANLGYDAAWHGLTAASVGAPHGRFRVFIVAWPQSGDTDRVNQQRWPTAGFQGQAGSQVGSAADTGEVGRDGRAGELGSGRWGEPADGGYIATDTACDGRHEGWPEPAGIVWGHDAAQRGRAVAPDAISVQPERRGDRRDVGGAQAGDEGPGRQRERVRDTTVDSGSVAPDPIGGRCAGRSHDPIGEQVQRTPAAGSGAGDIAWGQFEPAIRRWEQLTRPAPAPTELSAKGNQRLSPKFVEWMMGLPEGHVTGVPGLTRNEQLKALGNGVVPQQAEAAIRYLLGAMAVAA